MRYLFCLNLRDKSHLMSSLNFPIHFKFKISSLSNDFSATDNDGNTIAYVRQKMFKLKEDIEIFSDESRQQKLYRIRADRWLDFSAAYSFYDSSQQGIGKIARKGWRSIFKAEYEIIDQNEEFQFRIQEENAWIKIIDGLLGEIPLLGFLSGYFFNPTYLLEDKNQNGVVRLRKVQSFWGRRFIVEKLRDVEYDDEIRIVLGLMMMVLLERSRG